MQLAPYQLIGLNWLILMHTQELNGILGDEMVNEHVPYSDQYRNVFANLYHIHAILLHCSLFPTLGFRQNNSDYSFPHISVRRR